MANIPNDSRPFCDDSQPLEGPTPVIHREVDTVGIGHQLDTVAADLSSAWVEVRSTLNDMADNAASVVYDAQSEVTTGVSDLVGTIDGNISEASAPVTNAIQKVANAAGKTLETAGYDVFASGINVPGDPTAQSQLLQLDDVALLQETIPQLGTNSAGFGSVFCDTNPTDPACVQRTPSGGSPPPPPVSPPTSPPPDDGECIYQEAIPIDAEKTGTPVAGFTGYVNSVSGLPCDPSEVPPVNTPPIEEACPAQCPPVAIQTSVVDACGNVTPITVTGSPVGGGGGAGGGFGSPPPPPPPGYFPPGPVPPPPPITESQLPDGQATAKCADWDVIDVCNVGTFTVPSSPPPPPTETLDDTKVRWAIEDTLKFVNGVMYITLPGYAAIKAGSNLVAGHDGIESFATTYHIGKKLANDLVDTFTGNCVAEKKTVAALAALLGTANWCETITGAPIRYLSQSNVYQFQFLNPQILPGQADTDNLWLRNKITEQTWECLTKAQGNLPGWHRAARDAKQALLTPDQLTQAWRRGYLTEANYYDTLAENGYINANYKAITQLLSDLPLGASDLVRCMVRDSGDEQVVKKYEYDKDFDQKFTGKFKEWAYWQGYTEEQFRYIWRAHWEVPSNTAAWEMLHRLRPDRQDVRDWELNAPRGDDGNADPNAPGKPPTVTKEDIRELLEINDMAPAWIDRLIATSYHTITNSDASRMYQLGYFDDNQLTSSFQDNGYTEDDAKLLQGYWKFETNKRVRNQSGVLTPRKAISLYKDGAFDRAELRDALKDVFPNADQLDTLVDLTDKQVDAEAKQAKAKSIKRSLLTGEYSRAEAIAGLQALGINQEAANRMTQIWEADQQHRSREVTALMLCKWRDRGLITTNQHVERLKRLGYPDVDAQAIARVCDMDSAKRRAKEALAAAKSAAKDAKSNLMKQIADLRKELADLAKQYKWYMDQLGLMPDTPPGMDQNSSAGGGGG